MDLEDLRNSISLKPYEEFAAGIADGVDDKPAALDTKEYIKGYECGKKCRLINSLNKVLRSSEEKHFRDLDEHKRFTAGLWQGRLNIEPSDPNDELYMRGYRQGCVRIDADETHE